ncbi:hypothetical protein Pst134EB_001374 [Puccinia striiformis f. sp. tritici]|nr:hypothetical protein Pst134EB_001374 [Puccinia striiformis f. sp. tritici]
MFRFRIDAILSTLILLNNLISIESKVVLMRDNDHQTYDHGSNIGEKCFPSPSISLSLPHPLSPSPKHWWCSQFDEYAWLGFSYHVGDCPSRATMTKTFAWMRGEKKARYVRLYGGCDAIGFDDDVIEAAVKSGVGIYALIWFGFDNDDKWKGRKERLLHAIKNNPKAPYVIRAVTCGSEPLYDKVLPIPEIVVQIKDLKKQLEPFGIPVTLSEMPAGYQANGDTPEIFEAVDFVSLHSFAFFEGNATTADHGAQIAIRNDVQYGLQHSGHRKKVVLTQTGWPSNMKMWKANSPNAIADIYQEFRYFQILDHNCNYFKDNKISWFAHVYNETSVAGWGIYYANGTEKFKFNPRISC